MTTSLGSLLVVDDEEMNRDMLSRRLNVEGYDVVTASGGAEALGMIAEQHFDAVLLDVMMPVQNGYEVLAEIRKTHTSLELPILMVTAKHQNDDIVHAFGAGANDYITKPINFPVALARINCHVASKRMSSQLRESETRYSLSARGANDGLWDWDLVSNRVFYSTRWKSMLGYEPEDVGDSIEEWFGRVHPDDLPHVQKALDAHLTHQTEQFESEHRMRHNDQSYRWVLTRGVASTDGTGRQTRMAGSQTDITRGKAADPLTGLPNRVLFMDHLEAAVALAQKDPNFLYAVLFLDLDRFKIVNDSLGHHIGDQLLVEVAQRLESCMRATDVISRLGDRSTIARFGGDEFVILLKDVKEPKNASHVADRILSALEEPLTLQGHRVSVSASIGIAIGTSAEICPHDLLRDADTAMYQAKSYGKARSCVFDHRMRAQVVERLTLEADLKRGLQRNEFQVYYQPIVSLASGRIVGFEALLRWLHPVRGTVCPEEFVPIAEETGFIIELGYWVLVQACRQLHSWQKTHPHAVPLFISVNVSTKQFADIALADKVAACLADTGLEARCLKLEITESALMNDLGLATTTLERLHALGVHISLDDFGTGYSSLSYLQQFPIDTIKIDRSFVHRIEGSPQAEEIVKTIVALAHGLGMKVTAEGIENHAQLSMLHNVACETGQGFLYARPAPQASIEALLEENDRYHTDDQSVRFGNRILLPESLAANLNPKDAGTPIEIDESDLRELKAAKSTLPADLTETI